jgi:hypothetical protein
MGRPTFQRKQLIHKASGMVFNAVPALEGHPEYEEYTPEHVVPAPAEHAPETGDLFAAVKEDLAVDFDSDLGADIDAELREIVDYVEAPVTTKRRGRPAKGAADGSHAQ